MAYRSSTSNTGNSQSPATAVPAGAAAGDIVVLVATFDNNLSDWTVGKWPAGFAVLQTATATAPDGQDSSIGWKALTGADSGSYTFGAVRASAAAWQCQAVALSNRHATNPAVASAVAVNQVANTSPVTATATGVTAVQGDDLVWMIVPDTTVSLAYIATTSPTSFVLRQESKNTFAGLASATQDNVNVGATGNQSGTFTLSSGSAGWAAYLVRVPVGAVVDNTTKPALAGMFTPQLRSDGWF